MVRDGGPPHARNGNWEGASPWGTRVGAPGSQGAIRAYCAQVWKAARLWDRIEKAVRAEEFTFPGDPMRIDYGYRRKAHIWVRSRT
jgi:hypothetical protein